MERLIFQQEKINTHADTNAKYGMAKYGST